MTIVVLQDLRPQLGPARNQGSRPVCIAFAFSDGHAAARLSHEPLSVEHLYYNAVQRSPGKDPHQGVNMPTCREALLEEGQCVEVGWPYLDPLVELASWTPPASATPAFHRRTELGAASSATILAELDAGRSVIIAMLLGERFYSPDAEGRITHGPGDADTDYHAVLAVGHGRDDSNPYILVRNSWGAEWGLGGHSWIAADYLEPRLYALARFPSQETV